MIGLEKIIGRVNLDLRHLGSKVAEEYFNLEGHEAGHPLIGDILFRDENCNEWILQPDGELVLQGKATTPPPKSLQSGA